MAGAEGSRGLAPLWFAATCLSGCFLRGNEIMHKVGCLCTPLEPTPGQCQMETDNLGEYKRKSCGGGDFCLFAGEDSVSLKETRRLWNPFGKTAEFLAGALRVRGYLQWFN